MRSYIGEVRLAIRGIVTPPQVDSWLTIYTSPEATQKEMLHTLNEKVWQIIEDDPSYSPFWARNTHRELQRLCNGSWWRRIVARMVVEYVVSEDVREGVIITDPGHLTSDGQRTHHLWVRPSKN